MRLTGNKSTTMAALEAIKEISLEGLSINEARIELAMHSKMLAAIDEVAWMEHTADWDPYLVVTKTDGTQFETPSGYWSYRIKDSYHRLDQMEVAHFEELDAIDFDTDSEDDEPIVVKIADIKSIKVVIQ